jgi:hypothetical protein
MSHALDCHIVSLVDPGGRTSNRQLAAFHFESHAAAFRETLRARLAAIARKANGDRDRDDLEFLQNIGIPPGAYSLAKLGQFDFSVDRLCIQINLPDALQSFGLTD